MNKAISYKRRGTEGVLSLGGTMDIFEAANLHTAACKALHDKKAVTVCVELAEVKRLDVTTLQILCALQRDVMTEGRAFVFRVPPDQVIKQFVGIGLSISATEPS